MTIKENLPSAPLQALSGFSVLAMQGRDAEAFAQAQFMNDLRALEVGQWQWSGWLNPKGRLIALFALLRRGEGELWLILPDLDAAALAERLQRFVFRSKLTMAPLAGWTVAASWPPEPSADAGDRAVECAADLLALDWGSPQQARWLALVGPDRPPPAAADADADQRWQAFDLAHGLPRLNAAQVEAWTPQMLSLERLAAYSVKKGCYPGQEIVARTHFLGQAKRGLVRLAGNALQGGLAVLAEGQPLGHVVCASADGRQALAVLGAVEDGAVLATEQGACTPLPLLEGLRRPR